MSNDLAFLQGQKETEPSWRTVRQTMMTFENVCSAATETLTGIISGPIVNLLFPKSVACKKSSPSRQASFTGTKQTLCKKVCVLTVIGTL